MEYAAANVWLEQKGLVPVILDAAASFRKNGSANIEPMLDKVMGRCLDDLAGGGGPETLLVRQVAEEIAFRISQGESRWS